MKASELRIGNLAYGINRRSDVHFPENLPLRIWEIGIFNSEVLPMDQSAAETEKWFKITNSDLSPIPLTEEWLKRINWNGYNYLCINSYFKLDIMLDTCIIMEILYRN